MKSKKVSLIVGSLLIVVGSAAWLRARTPSKMPTSQQLQKAFPGDAKQVFEDSQQFTLLSLDPSGIGGYEGKDAFHGYRIIGRTQVSRENKARLIAAFYNGMAENSDSAAACFSPRHGIRAVRGAEAVDVVICFSCLQAAIYAGKKSSGALTSGSPRATFDAVLQESSVPLSP